jgi:hypothetical protein
MEYLSFHAKYPGIFAGIAGIYSVTSTCIRWNNYKKHWNIFHVGINSDTLEEADDIRG